MPQIQTAPLPLLPLANTVVLPGMVITVPLDRGDARAAIEAARAGEGLVLLVPRVEATYARVGVVGRVADAGRLPNGVEVAVIEGLYRASPGGGEAGTGSALRVVAHPIDDVNALTDQARVLAREYKALLENLLERRGGNDAIETIRAIDRPSQLADLSGYSRELSLQRKIEVLETVDVEARLVKLIAWTRELLAQESLRDKIRS